MSSFNNFAEFYTYYLKEHSNLTCRRLHLVGTSAALGCVLHFINTGNVASLILALIAGYGLAWIGHFFFEQNRPATFRHPLYSFMGDWRMLWEMLTGKIKV